MSDNGDAFLRRIGAFIAITVALVGAVFAIDARIERSVASERIERKEADKRVEKTLERLESKIDDLNKWLREGH